MFCEIAAGTATAKIVRRWDDAVAIYPRNGGVAQERHILILPAVHVANMRENPKVTGLVAERGAELANELGWPDNNYATNCGRWGGQTVDHLHGHLVYADEERQNTMPWFGQQLRDGREFWVGLDGYGDLTLWTGDAARPVPVAAKHQLDDMDPILWPLVTRVLEPMHLTKDGDPDARR